MHDNLLLRAAKSGQAEDGVQDGKSGGGDVPPPVEGLAQARMIMRYLPIRRVLKPYPVNRRGVPAPIGTLSC